jgi:uncharacterized Zn-binding protein involved in type VI secretion
MSLNVDWNWIAQNEGIVPVPYFDKNDSNPSLSTISIGVGVQLSNRTASEMSWFDTVDPVLKAKLTPFVGVIGDFSVIGGMIYAPLNYDYRFVSNQGFIGNIATSNPGWFPLSTAEQATLLDFAKFLTEEEAEPRWVATSLFACELDLMPPEIQTVFIDLYHQLGNFGPGGRDYDLWQELVTGKWVDAIVNLRSWTVAGVPPQWQPRNEARADKLQTAIDAGLGYWPCSLTITYPPPGAQPAAIRKSRDSSMGHGCFPPRPPDQGSLNVTVNSIAVVTIGHHYPSHPDCPPLPPHDGAASGGSGTVFVNGQGIHRHGDEIDCGDYASNGSSNVFVG